MSTISITATVEAANVPPRVRLDVSASPTTTTSTTITRLDPSGSTVPVRTSDGNPLVLSSGIGLLYDPEVPYDAPVSYSSLESPLTFSAQVTVPASQVWLTHPGVPALSMPITVAVFGDRARKVQRGVFYPMGRGTPVVVTDGARKSVESSFDVKIDNPDTLEALMAITSDGSDLLLNVPSGLGWGVPTCYIAVGDITESRLVDYAAEPARYVTMPFVVVDRPAGGSQAERTLADIYADYATLADVRAAYTNLTAVLAGP
ncbi:MAG: hypothetical protein JWO98_4741 [Frankiales bacterium]|nr:hypothetical protein [Frankiales bacterium]